jgi:hypothetical protein
VICVIVWLAVVNVTLGGSFGKEWMLVSMHGLIE